MSHFVQFTARKRDPITGERNRWRHGPYGDLDVALAHVRNMRRLFGRSVLVEVKIPSKKAGAIHALRTRAGMARARAKGKRIGRPRARFDLRNVRCIMRYHTRGLGMLADSYGVSVSTLKRALRSGSKGVTGNPRSKGKGTP